jgi:hypothetical protein
MLNLFTGMLRKDSHEFENQAAGLNYNFRVFGKSFSEIWGGRAAVAALQIAIHLPLSLYLSLSIYIYTHRFMLVAFLGEIPSLK